MLESPTAINGQLLFGSDERISHFGFRTIKNSSVQLVALSFKLLRCDTMTLVKVVAFLLGVAFFLVLLSCITVALGPFLGLCHD